jgi:ribosomal protein S18 acetylase RimI-like enzyme
MPTLRNASVTDAAAVAALHIASWRAAYWAELPSAFLESQSLAERTAVWRARLADARAHLLLLEEGELLVGFAAFGASRDTDADPSLVWELYNLHILPHRRGSGLGAQLFEAASERGRAAGRRTLTLWVVEGNVPARRFYQRHGMQPDGATQLHEVGPGVALHEVRYRRPLD